MRTSIKGVVISEEKRIFVSKENSSWSWSLFFLLVGATVNVSRSEGASV